MISSLICVTFLFIISAISLNSSFPFAIIFFEFLLFLFIKSKKDVTPAFKLSKFVTILFVNSVKRRFIKIFTTSTKENMIILSVFESTNLSKFFVLLSYDFFNFLTLDIIFDKVVEYGMLF